MGSVRFFTEEIAFLLPHPRKTTAWIKEVIHQEKKHLSAINYIFCNDKYLLRLNQGFLKHSTLTDIITFDNSMQSGIIEAEIYISINRVSENAQKFKVSFDEELHRVIIHGVLHLIGFKDKKSTEKALMRKKEEAYLSLRRKKVSRGT